MPGIMSWQSSCHGIRRTLQPARRRLSVITGMELKGYGIKLRPMHFIAEYHSYGAAITSLHRLRSSVTGTGNLRAIIPLPNLSRLTWIGCWVVIHGAAA